MLFSLVASFARCACRDPHRCRGTRLPEDRRRSHSGLTCRAPVTWLLTACAIFAPLAALSARGQTCTSAPAGLVAWYPGDDCGPGDLLGLHSGAFVGLPECSVDWMVGGGAISIFPVPATYVVVPSAGDLNFGAGDFSIDLWIKVATPVSGVQPILDKRTSSPLVGYHIALFNGYLLVQLADGIGSAATNYFTTLDANLFVADGQWHFIAVTVDRNNPSGLVMYVDNYSRSFNPTGRQGTLSNGASLLIGARNPGLGGGYFHGLLDEVELFNRALTQTEVQAIFLAGSAGKCKACVPLQPVCTDPIQSVDPRPFWQELQPPGYPDYENVTSNLQLMNSIRLLASIATRAAQKMEDLSSQLDYDEALGRCVCSLTENHSDVKRKNCNTSGPQCPTSSPDCCPCNNCSQLQGSYPLWLPTDLFKDTKNTTRFFLKHLGFLDKMKKVVDEFSNSALHQALVNLGTDLSNLADLLSKYAEYVDLLTEGYHLGGYSTERPDLHLCVGYGGHGAFAEMADLFGGEVSIGSRYTSHNLSAEHRAQFRSGGFGVRAFGKTLSILPGIEANLQIDGFKMWDAEKPFGINMPSAGDCTCTGGCGFRLTDVEKYDIFHLMDESADVTCTNGSGIACFDDPSFGGNGDGCVQPGEFIIKDFYKATYLSAADNQSHHWPRIDFEDCDWEKTTTAVFGAGLNFDPKLKQIKKCGLPPHTCPDSGITIFAGPPPAKLFVIFTLDSGAEWKHAANDLRDSLKDAINKPLPASLQLTADDFERPMHYLQAPDVSADDASSAFVKPRIAGDLLVGIHLKRFLRLGITVTIGIAVRVEPGAHGGVYDFNVALADTLLNSNPPKDVPCDPIIETTETIRCSNLLHVDPDTSDPLSSGTYSCETSEIVTYHCKEPEQDTECEPANAEDDCPRTGECVPEYGCVAHGYCTRILSPGPDELEGTEDDVVDVVHDTTDAACSGDAVCDQPAVNAGAGCDKDADCPALRQCAAGKNAGQPCTTKSDCPRSECQTPTAPCVQISPAGYFTPYQCLISAAPEITGWQGPGCHPLTVGFPSACGCTTDADCVAAEENCVDGACHYLVNGQPVPCDCDPGNFACTPGRTCVEGGCLLDCATNADCAVHQICDGGVCVNPYGIPFAEQIVWQMTHTPNPQHAVGTYALSEILVSAFLDAGLWIGLDLKIFKKSYHFDLLKLTKYWPLGNPSNKAWFQPGLEARYQNDCDPAAGSTVTNWQPDGQRVNRYPTSLPGTGTYGNAGTVEDLLSWCSNELPIHVADPDEPSENSLADAMTDIANWGEGLGLDIWGVSGVCVSTPGGHGLTEEQPLTDWIGNLNTSVQGLMCRYTFNNQMYTFPCADLRNQMLLIWGCLDVAANPHATILAGAFPGIVTTFQGRPVLDLNAMLVDPTAEFELQNVKAPLRNHGLFQGVLWYSAVSQCFDSRFGQLQPGDIELLGVDIHPCCGNGVMDTGGCGQGVGTPCEGCDDGNNLAGDGCSPLCRIEGRTIPIGCGDGTTQAGFGEQCDGTDDVACRGLCQADCTCPRFIRGDRDGDGDLDLDDFTEMPDCMSGPGSPYGDIDCAIFDGHVDDYIDLLDFQRFQACFAGPDVAASNCEN